MYAQGIVFVNVWREWAGIATGYGLDGPGIESRWGEGEIFRTFPGRSASYTIGTGSFPGLKRPGRGVDHRPSSSV